MGWGETIEKNGEEREAGGDETTCYDWQKNTMRKTSGFLDMIYGGHMCLSYLDLDLDRGRDRMRGEDGSGVPHDVWHVMSCHVMLATCLLYVLICDARGLALIFDRHSEGK